MYILDVSYTRAPDWVKLIPGEVNDKHATFWSLAALAYQQTGDEAREGRTPRPSDQHHVELPPDDQLMCFDYLYYVCAQRVSNLAHTAQVTGFTDRDSRSLLNMASISVLRGDSLHNI